MLIGFSSRRGRYIAKMWRNVYCYAWCRQTIPVSYYSLSADDTAIVLYKSIRILYFTAGYELLPQINYLGYESSLKRIMDLCEALLKNCNLKFGQIDLFIEKLLDTIAVGCIN